MQAKLDSLATHRWIVEMLQPPSTRSCTGTWIRGGEMLLRELPSADQLTAEKKVRPANNVHEVCTMISDYKLKVLLANLRCPRGTKARIDVMPACRTSNVLPLLSHASMHPDQHNCHRRLQTALHCAQQPLQCTFNPALHAPTSAH